MKLLWFSLTTFYVIIHQKHLVITAQDPSYDPLEPSILSASTETQTNFIADLSRQIFAVLQRKMDIPRTDLEKYDEPVAQNHINFDGDELLDGKLLMHDVVIDGLNEIKEDGISAVLEESKVHMAVNLKKLVIRGEYSVLTPKIGVDEKWPFSVTLTNVRIEGVAYLIRDPMKNFQISKLVPTILSEEAQTWVKSKTVPIGAILKVAQAHLELTMKKRFARIATLEILMNYPNYVPANPISQKSLAMFAAQLFVSQRYDPHRFRAIIQSDHSSSWNLSAINLHGLSKFRLMETELTVTNTSVTIIVQINTESLHGNFLFFVKQACLVEFSIERLDFIGKLKLMVDSSLSVPIVENLGMEMTGCNCRFRNKVTGMPIDQSELGFDAGDVFCMLIRSEFSSGRIMKNVQSEIFNYVYIKNFETSLQRLIQEEKYLAMEST